MIRAFAASSGGVDFASEEYQAMIAKSLLSTGNNQRLKNAIEKAKRGEEITIAYIGGSITQGQEPVLSIPIVMPINPICALKRCLGKMVVIIFILSRLVLVVPLPS